MSDKLSLDEVVRKYRIAAECAGDLSNPGEQNKWAGHLHTCYKQLRDSDTGRQAIIQLMEDVNLSVRGWAAAHCLQWVPDRARAVLEDIRRQNVFPFSFDAEMVLNEYDNGRLTFDY
jgi:hypothetical protein